MKKQIVYCNLTPRILAMIIDLAILAITAMPVMSIVSQYIFAYIFSDFFAMHAVDLHDKVAIYKAINTTEFISHVTTGKFFGYCTITFLLNICIMLLYFMFFWSKFSATPGKMIMRMKIVDADSFARPTNYMLIKRFLGYTTVLIGIWSIIFNKRKMALHDKIANTVVIKS